MWVNVWYMNTSVVPWYLMKKFKYQGTTDVFMQCKIRACAQQPEPCGICAGSGDPRALQSVDLSPAEGEMFAPPVSVRVNARDNNALTFAVPTGTNPASTERSRSTAPEVHVFIQARSSWEK